MPKTLYLIAEYCPAQFYMGWHLYLRDSNKRQQRNADGSWGWIRSRDIKWTGVQRILDELGIVIKGDGTCDYDGIAEIARRFPLGRQRVGGKPRGCVELIQCDDGSLAIAEAVHA